MKFHNDEQGEELAESFHKYISYFAFAMSAACLVLAAAECAAGFWHRKGAAQHRQRLQEIQAIKARQSVTYEFIDPRDFPQA